MADDKKGKKKQDENKGFGDDDDNFGLPDLDFEPLDRDEPEASAEPEKPKRGRPKKAASAKKTPAKKTAAKKTTAKKATTKKATTKKTAATKTTAKPEKDEKPAVEEAPFVAPVEESTPEAPAVEESTSTPEPFFEDPTPVTEPDFSFEDTGQEDEPVTTAEDFDLKYSDVNEDDPPEPKPKEMKEEERKSMTPIIVSLIILLLVIGAVLGYLFWYKPMQDQKTFTAAIEQGDKALQEGRYEDALAEFNKAKELRPADGQVDERITAVQSARTAAANKKKAEDEAAAKAADEARLAAEAEAEANKQPEAGTVEVLSARTGQYYVVVASSIDGDLAMDHANRLAKKGVGVQILSPLGKVKYHRVTIRRTDSFQSAQDQADELKSEYRNAWVVKY